MTFTVSISELRNNLAQYLERVANGANLLVRDEKKNRFVAQLVGKKQFDPEGFVRTLKAASGIFTIQNHPEWATKRDVTSWLKAERKSADRHF